MVKAVVPRYNYIESFLMEYWTKHYQVVRKSKFHFRVSKKCSSSIQNWNFGTEVMIFCMPCPWWRLWCPGIIPSNLFWCSSGQNIIKLFENQNFTAEGLTNALVSSKAKNFGTEVMIFFMPCPWWMLWCPGIIPSNLFYVVVDKTLSSCPKIKISRQRVQEML